jgi:hypothetical protein
VINIILDIINIIFILTILLIIYKYYNIKNLYFIILVFHLCGIFIYNGFLFDPSYMPDQFKYLAMVQDLRNFDISMFKLGTVGFTSIIFALFPIPFIVSIYSIGFINYILYLFLFIFMIKKNILNNKISIYFYLLFPSLLMYSSLALRDILIFTVMFFGIYFLLVRQKYVLSFLILGILFFIKFQNLLLITVAVSILLVISKEVKIRNIFFIFLIFIIIFLNLSDYLSIEKLEYFRVYFYLQNHSPDNYIPLLTYYDIILRMVPDAIYFIVRPLPWIEIGLFQFIQFIENIIVLFLIIYILMLEKKYLLFKNKEIIFLNFLLLSSIILYGLVIFNSGTAVRYKFPFIVIYVIYSLYFINIFKNKKKVNVKPKQIKITN